MNTLTFIGGNQKEINATIWLPETQPNYILQIVHGMTEHIGRYHNFAKELNTYGIGVVGFDLRGHGHNDSLPQIASFKEDGWQASLEDIHACKQAIIKQYPNTPIYILGFSLGSFLVREYLSLYPENIAGAIIAGTGKQPKAILSIIKALVKKEIQKNGFDQTTPLVKKLSFETYNQKFKPNRTEADWLCYDKQELDNYLNDPLCRKYISSGLFYQLLDSMQKTGENNIYTNYPNIPYLLLSGEKDAVGDFTKGILQVQKDMEKHQLQVETHLLPNARHDIFHEVDTGTTHKVIQIIHHWIKK